MPAPAKIMDQKKSGRKILWNFLCVTIIKGIQKRQKWLENGVFPKLGTLTQTRFSKYKKYDILGKPPCSRTKIVKRAVAIQPHHLRTPKPFQVLKHKTLDLGRDLDRDPLAPRLGLRMHRFLRNRQCLIDIAALLLLKNRALLVLWNFWTCFVNDEFSDWMVTRTQDVTGTGFHS